MDTITDKFKTFLIDSGVSKLTIKNYISDLNQFANWLIAYTTQIGVHANNLTEAVPFINDNTANEYKTSLASSTSSKLTINRKLSTLRKFGSFLTIEGVMDYDFTSNLVNLSTTTKKTKKQVPSKQELKGFEEYLTSQGVSKNTLKNYSADVRQFLAWADEY